MENRHPISSGAHQQQIQNQALPSMNGIASTSTPDSSSQQHPLADQGPYDPFILLPHKGNFSRWIEEGMTERQRMMLRTMVAKHLEQQFRRSFECNFGRNSTLEADLLSFAEDRGHGYHGAYPLCWLWQKRYLIVEDRGGDYEEDYEVTVDIMMLMHLSMRRKNNGGISGGVS